MSEIDEDAQANGEEIENQSEDNTENNPEEGNDEDEVEEYAEFDENGGAQTVDQVMNIPTDEEQGANLINAKKIFFNAGGGER